MSWHATRPSHGSAARSGCARSTSSHPGAAGSAEEEDQSGSADLAIASVDVELAVEAREALRTLAATTGSASVARCCCLTGYSYREPEPCCVTYTNVNHHVTEGRAAARRLRNAA